MHLGISVEHGVIGKVDLQRGVDLQYGENPHSVIEKELHEMVTQVVTLFTTQKGD